MFPRIGRLPNLKNLNPGNLPGFFLKNLKVPGTLQVKRANMKRICGVYTEFFYELKRLVKDIAKLYINCPGYSIQSTLQLNSYKK
jgi:hypothetical protein